MADRRSLSGLRFRVELRDFLRFVRRPRIAPRLVPRTATHVCGADWFPAVSLWRLMQWALLLWSINLVFLGPLAVYAATLGGAQHRLDIQNLPWLQALLWAPLVEELVFRYGLRRIRQALWLVPAATCALVFGPLEATIALVAAILLLSWLPCVQGAPRSCRRPMAWRNRVRYIRYFPWIFHLSSLLFAAVHLNNFSLHQMPYWLMPLLVLPQWLTGLVLGWLRVRRGIGASVLLHAIFNGGPLLLVWIILRSVPELLV